MAQTVFFFLLIIAWSKDSIMITKQDLPNEVLIRLLYEYKIKDIILKKNFFPAGWLLGVDSQQTFWATTTSSMSLRSKQLPLKYNIYNEIKPQLLCVFL